MLILLLLVLGSYAQSDVVVSTAQGLLRGLHANNTYYFYAIPYAKPPIGPLRFKPPQFPVPTWSDVRDAQTQRPPCIQADTFIFLNQTNEDCLYLNIYIPDIAILNGTMKEKLPVMLWIPGGGFNSGYANFFDGTFLTSSSLTSNRQIIVIINYRVGPFGFLALDELKQESGTAGNYGLQDQQAAITWVYDNIIQFGGDRDRITLFGDSAGGLSVLAQMVTPTLPDGMFQAAIIQSGIISFFRENDWNSAIDIGNRIKKATNCDDVQCLRNLNATTLYNSAINFTYMPTIDGTFFTRPILDSVQDGQFKKVPVVIGSTQTEFSDRYCNSNFPNNMTLNHVIGLLHSAYGWRIGNMVLEYYDFGAYRSGRDFLVDIFADQTVHCPTRRVALQLSAYVDTYFYTFQKNISMYTPNCIGANHFTDVLFLFPQSAEKGRPSFGVPKGYKLTADETWVSQYMNALWTVFAQSPTSPSSSVFQALGLPGWQKFDYDSEYDLAINYGNLSMTRSLYYKRVCELWDNPNKQMLITLAIIVTILTIIFSVIIVVVIFYFRDRYENHKKTHLEKIQFYNSY